MHNAPLRSFLLLLLLALLVAACGQEGSDPTPLPPSPTSSEAAQVEASATAAPTNSPVPATATTEATETAVPTATATATATPAPLFLQSAEDFSDERNPLTGEVVDDPSVLQRRPIAVKISNSPPSYVRPQSGLSQADLVFEHETEGPITRFTAIIYSQTPPDMGPIRSGRLIDLEIPLMFDAAFAYSGSSIGVSQKLQASSFVNRILRTNAPGYYRTGEDKPFEHTLYGDPSLWRQELENRGENHPPEFSNYMAFSEEPPEGGESVSHININHRDRAIIDWYYDEEIGRYWRSSDGEEHYDENTGERLSTDNVVVVFAQHVTNYNICEHVVDGTCQAYSVEVQIWGEGPALIFRDGRQYEATWQREQPEHMLTFYDADGNPLPLKIGNTWFQMVPIRYQDPVTVE